MKAPHPFQFPENSLGRYITRRVLLLSLTALLGLGVTIFMTFWVTLDQVQARLDRVSSEVGGDYKRFFQGIERDLNASAAGFSGQPNPVEALLNLRALDSDFVDVLEINAHGGVLAQSSAPRRPRLMEIEPPAWLQPPPAAGEVALGPLSYEGDTPYIELAAPVLKNNGVYLLVRVSLADLWETVFIHKAGRSGYAYVVDGAGRLVAGDPNRWQVAPGTSLAAFSDRRPADAAKLSQYRGLGGEPVLGATVSMDALPWYVVAEQPVFEAMETFLVPTIVLLATLGVIGWQLFSNMHFVHNRLVTPLLELRDTVLQMADVQSRQRVELRQEDELGQLAQAFNVMADQRQNAFDNLARQYEELRQAQSALSESEALFRFLAENSTDMISRHDPQGVYLYVSPACQALLGYTPEELVGHSAYDFIDPQDAARVESSRQSVVGGPAPAISTIDYRVQRKNGQVVWLETLSHAVYDDSGATVEIYAASRDVTARRRAAEDLRQSEMRFRSLIERNPEPNAVQRNGVIIFANPATLKLVGASTLGELIGKPMLSLLPSEYHQVALEEAQRITAGEYIQPTVERKVMRLDGTVIDIELQGTSITFDGEPAIHLVMRDITERKRLENALRESEEKFSKIFHAAPVWIAMTDMQTAAYLDLNEAGAEGIGFSREEVVGKTAVGIGLIRPEDRQRLVEEIRQHGKILGLDMEFHTRGGLRRGWVTGDEVVIQGRSYLLTVTVDLTERLRAEEALRRNMQLERERSVELQAIMDTVPAAVSIAHDQQCHLITGNRALYQLLGMPFQSNTSLSQPESAHLNHYKVLVGGGDLPTDQLPMQVSASTGASFQGIEEQIIFDDGRVVDIYGNVAPLYDAENRLRGSVAAFVDITAARQANEQVKRSLAEKETLLRELYHRTKNNMAVIIALLDLQMGDFDDPHLRSAFQDAKNRINSMALVHQKLYEAQNLSHINLKDYIQDLVELLRITYSVAPEKTAFQLDLEDAFVLIDSAIPCGLILNELISNMFKYAFPTQTQGEVRITLRHQPDGMIEMSVADNGVGVPPGFDFRRDGHMGMRTIHILCEHQLQGQVEFIPGSPGLTCRVRFQDIYYQPRI